MRFQKRTIFLYVFIDFFEKSKKKVYKSCLFSSLFFVCNFFLIKYFPRIYFSDGAYILYYHTIFSYQNENGKNTSKRDDKNFVHVFFFFWKKGKNWYGFLKRCFSDSTFFLFLGKSRFLFYWVWEWESLLE
jgi:hypothetical protein